MGAPLGAPGALCGGGAPPGGPLPGIGLLFGGALGGGGGIPFWACFMAFFCALDILGFLAIFGFLGGPGCLW